MRSADITWKLTQPGDSNWSGLITEIRRHCPAERSAGLFPDHFLLRAFPSIGGAILWKPGRDNLEAAALAFPGPPRQSVEPAPNLLSPVPPSKRQTVKVLRNVFGSMSELQSASEHLLPGRVCELYEPFSQDNPDVLMVGALQNGCVESNVAMGSEIRRMQRRIWNAPDAALYPADIHRKRFSACVSLVALVEGELAGFLFGFFHTPSRQQPEELDAGANIRTDVGDISYDSDREGALCVFESQLLGVDPRFRGRGIALDLKWAQAERLKALGIRQVRWTADPLQWPNAVLNLNRVGAVADRCYRDYYPFRNDLNRLPASRLRMTWLLNTSRVQQRWQQFRAGQRDVSIPKLSDFTDVVTLNEGPNVIATSEGASCFALEIPEEWTTLQRLDSGHAGAWRETTDRLLTELLNRRDYLLSAVARDVGRCYLIASPVNEALRAAGSL